MPPTPAPGSIAWTDLTVRYLVGAIPSFRILLVADRVHRLCLVAERGELENTLILFLSDNGASPERPSWPTHLVRTWLCSRVPCSSPT